MKNRIATYFALCCVAVAAATYGLAATAAEDAPTKPAAQWQHLALTHEGANIQVQPLSSQIVRLGNDGWELVTVSTVVEGGETKATIFFFKKPQ